MRARRWLLALACLVWARPAVAHPAPYSYVDLYLDADLVRGSVVVHVFDVAHELGMPSSEPLLDRDMARSIEAPLRALLAGRMQLDAGSRSQAIAWGRVDVVPDRQAVRVAFEAPGVSSGRVSLTAHLFPYDPQHQTFVNVYEGGSLRDQAILDARRTTYHHYSGSVRGIGAVVTTFVPAGVHHILIGPDHVLFLVALVILGGSLARLLAIVTAFTVGHSITLSLAATGTFTLPATLVEPAIALSIVVVGVDNLLVRGAPGTRDLRPWAALAFGLVHGFGFASVLREIGLPSRALGWSLFSFNLGVELGQIGVVVAVVALVMGIRRQSAVLADRVAFAGSLAVVAAGAWWFTERTFLSGGLQ